MKKMLLFISLLLITISLYLKHNSNQHIDIVPEIIPVTPVVPIPQPEPIPLPKPVLKTNTIHNDISLAQKLCIEHNKQLIIIFSADWCLFCHKLKDDIHKFNTKKYILCIIDIDKSKELAKKFAIKILPTSVMCDSELNEISRKTGYSHKDYANWLESTKL